MTRLKLCGLTRPEDIACVNALKPEYIGFVFWPRSRRNVTKEQAASLKALLDPSIQAVGVFVDKDLQEVLELLEEGIIDIAQLHGKEDDIYIKTLKEKSGKTIIKAYTIRCMEDVARANASIADYVLVDSGKGSGVTFDWALLQAMTRPYFLAGGLSLNNVEEATRRLSPFALDVSSGIETDGFKDPNKMKQFVKIARL